MLRGTNQKLQKCYKGDITQYHIECITKQNHYIPVK